MFPIGSDWADSDDISGDLQIGIASDRVKFGSDWNKVKSRAKQDWLNSAFLHFVLCSVKAVSLSCKEFRKKIAERCSQEKTQLQCNVGYS